MWDGGEKWEPVQVQDQVLVLELELELDIIYMKTAGLCT